MKALTGNPNLTTTLSTEHFHTALLCPETNKNIRFKIVKLFLKEKIQTLQFLTLNVKKKDKRL